MNIGRGIVAEGVIMRAGNHNFYSFPAIITHTGFVIVTPELLFFINSLPFSDCCIEKKLLNSDVVFKAAINDYLYHV